MNAKDRVVFEKLLLERKIKLLAELGYIEESTMKQTLKDATGDLSGYSFHMADQATDSQEREKSFYFASKEGRFLNHLDDALERVKTKEYGKCMTCKDQIGKERLKALPHARFCITCKTEEEEKKRKGRA